MTTDPAPTSPLTPRAALEWLDSLSVDLVATAVLDATGNVLAGDPSLTQEGADVAARSERYCVVARAGPQALRRLVQADLEAAVAALEGR